MWANQSEKVQFCPLGFRDGVLWYDWEWLEHITVRAAMVDGSQMMFNRFQKVYVDTSVVSGKFDDVHSWQTEPFWNAVVKGEIRIMVSDVLRGELAIAPAHIRDFFKQLPKPQIELVNSNETTELLAARYVAEGVVGQSSLNDCRHIAIATIYRADCLVSLNFRHIVNANRIYRYNGINMLLGYPTIEIRNPYEVVNDET